MRKKKNGLLRFIDDKKKEKQRATSESNYYWDLLEKQRREKQEQERIRKEWEQFYYKIADKSKTIALEAGKVIMDCDDDGLHPYPIKADFVFDDIQIIWDKRYYEGEKRPGQYISSDEMKNTLFIYIDKIPVFQYRFGLGNYGEKRYYLDSDWYRVINELYNKLPKLKEQKQRKDDEFKQKTERYKSMNEVFKMYSTILKHGDPFVSRMIERFTSHGIVVKREEFKGLDFTYNGKSDSYSSSSYGVYKVYYKNNKVNEFYADSKSYEYRVNEYMVNQYIPGEWEFFFIRDIKDTYNEYLNREKNTVKSSINKSLTKLKKM